MAVPPYYVDLSGTWAVAQDGDLVGVGAFEGPYGMQKAVDTATAGQTVYIQDTADMRRLWLCSTGADNKIADGWAIGDDVQNHNDNGGVNGDDWDGIVCEIASDEVLIELDPGDIWANVDSADGIHNITVGDDLAGGDMGAVVSEPIRFDTQGGSAAVGFIKYIGTTAVWANDRTRCVFDAHGACSATAVIFSVSTQDYLWWENIEIDNSMDYGMYAHTAAAAYNVAINLYIHDCADHGLRAQEVLTYTRFYRCRMEANGGHGEDRARYSAWIACSFIDNSGNGASARSESFLGCVFHNNDTYGLYDNSSHSSFVAHCVFDENEPTGMGVYATAVTPHGLYVGNRFSNHSGVGGIGLGAVATVRPILIYNYFEDNTLNYDVDCEIIEGSTGIGSQAQDNADTDEGYTNRAGDDFSTRYVGVADPTERREDISLDGTSSYFLTAGLIADESGAGVGAGGVGSGRTFNRGMIT